MDVKRNGDHFGVGIISGSIWGSFRGRDHFGGCTVPNSLMVYAAERVFTTMILSKLDYFDFVWNNLAPRYKSLE